MKEGSRGGREVRRWGVGEFIYPIEILDSSMEIVERITIQADADY
jgi:hypothetical protein